MPFPESPREVYSRNPLKEVICQLRFPTILEVSAQSPANFQNQLRRHYPLYKLQDPIAGLPKEVSDILAVLPVPKLAQQPVHKFLTESERRFISLSAEFLALTETNYQRWEHFEAEIEKAERAFRDIYEPSFYSRIGLRYQDVIDRETLNLQAHPWSDLLNASVIGELGAVELAAQVEEIQTQSLVRLTEVPKGLVRIRHGLAKAEGGAKQVYIIDADFFTDERSDPDDAFRILGQFNWLAGRFFRWAITPVLRSAMEPTTIEPVARI